MRKNSLKQKLIKKEIIFSIQKYTTIQSCGQDLPEYVIKTYLSCFKKKLQTKNYQGHRKSEAKFIKTKMN